MESEDRVKQQAKAQAESISQMVAALDVDYDRLAELQEMQTALETDADAEGMSWAEVGEFEELKEAAGECKNRDEAEQRIHEDALSVEVRSGWQSLGETLEAAEFRIVLCTGGPHVQIAGELGMHNEPERAWLEYQDWGTPLTQYFDVDQDALLAYARQFYFDC